MLIRYERERKTPRKYHDIRSSPKLVAQGQGGEVEMEMRRSSINRQGEVGQIE